MVTKEEIDVLIGLARSWLRRNVDQPHEASQLYECITAIAEERDRLAAQVAELVALLRNVNLKGSSVEGAEEWDERRRALLAKHGATP